MKVFYDPDMAAAAPKRDTTRKSKLIADSLTADPIPGVDLAVIHPAISTLTETLIAQVHDLDYLRALVTGDPRDHAETSTLPWSPDTYRMAVAHAAGVVAATVDAVEGGHTGGTLSSGLHHARRHEGAGNCTINGLAVAALWVTLNHPDVKIVILDLDAHFGGGTADLIEDMPNVSQVDFCTNDWDMYEHPDAVLVTPGSYLPAVDWAIQRSLAKHPDIVIANMGVDPIDDGVTGSQLAARDCCVANRFRLAEVPVVFTLAGGYTSNVTDDDDLVHLHRTTIGAFA